MNNVARAATSDATWVVTGNATWIVTENSLKGIFYE